MAFEETQTLVRETAVDDTKASPRRRFTLPPKWNNDAAEEMLNFVDQAALVADDLRGLALLLKGIFETDCSRLSVEEDAALRIVRDCITSMAARLDSNSEQARERRNHLAAGGAR